MPFYACLSADRSHLPNFHHDFEAGHLQDMCETAGPIFWPLLLISSCQGYIQAPDRMTYSPAALFGEVQAPSQKLGVFGQALVLFPCAANRLGSTGTS